MADREPIRQTIKNHLPSGETAGGVWKQFRGLLSSAARAGTTAELTQLVAKASPGQIITYTGVHPVGDRDIGRFMHELRGVSPREVGASLQDGVERVEVIDNECQVPYVTEDAKNQQLDKHRSVYVVWRQQLGSMGRRRSTRMK